jgi:GNAT superfamily N-acetyltransferase
MTVLPADLLADLMADLPDGLSARLLTLDDADRLTAFRRRVVETLDDPDHYRMAGEVGDFVADHLGRRGITVGIFRGDAMVAYGALGLPGPGDPNRGRDLPLSDDALPLVAHMSSAMVEPAARGRGLHHRLIVWRLAAATALGRRHVLTTVSPRNHRSWGHLASHGLYPVRLVRVGGDLVRLLVHRDAQASPIFDTATAELVPVEELGGRWDVFDGGRQVWARVSVDGRWFALCGRARQAERRPVEPALA